MVEEVKVTQYRCKKCYLIGADKSEMEFHEAIPLWGVQLDFGGIYGLNETWKDQNLPGSFVFISSVSALENHQLIYTGELYSLAGKHTRKWPTFQPQLQRHGLENVVCKLDESQFQEAFDAINQRYDHSREDFKFGLGRNYSELDELNALDEYLERPLIQLVHGKIKNS
tara:strand:+ start:116 stop:622 length:507 start_codon:yes stop_codon:yes gene_type:complete